MKFLKNISEKAILAICALVAFFLLFCLKMQSNGMLEGGQDSYNHFLISKFAFQYPYLLLDQWGKPVYTILAHPFCAISLDAAVLFNISCLVLGAYILGITIIKLELKFAWLACWLGIFVPISLQNAIATLTEPLNLLMLSAAFYAWVSDKKIAATILFSFLPWIRTEGFVIIVPFIVFLMFSKNFKLLPWIIAGTFIFNILGWFQTGKIFWFITENPYFKIETDANRFAPGPGSFLFYINANKEIFGNLGLIAAVLGTLAFTYFYFFKKEMQKHGLFIFMVIAGVFVAYYFAHSFIIWKGMLGTHGMTRVMVVIVPCLAFFIAYLFTKIDLYLTNYQIWVTLSALLLALSITYQSYRVNQYPTVFFNWNKTSVKQMPNLANLDKAFEYITEKKLTDRVLYHQVPVFDVRYNRDPFAKPLTPNWKTANIWSIDLANNWAPKGSIIIWDSYHAQREGNMPIDKIMNAKDYQLLTKIKDFQDSLGPNDFYIFEKIQ